tara:strand:- start:475 stop:720 length:246 start_codon:yes stop_codon:yes gene_type:complete
MQIEPGQILDEYDVLTNELLARYIVVDTTDTFSSNRINVLCVYDSQEFDVPGSITCLDDSSILGNITIYWKLDGVRILDED